MQETRLDPICTICTFAPLKSSIEQRADSLKPYLDRGSVGITNDGLLVLRSSEGLNLKEKADIARLIDAENNDRNSLYSEIAKANNYGAERICRAGKSECR